MKTGILFDPGIEARIDALFAPYAQPGSPGYAVGIIHRGEDLIFIRQEAA